MHCFLKLLANEVHIYIFLPWMIILGWKVVMPASLKKINFPKILDQAPFLINNMIIGLAIRPSSLVRLVFLRGLYFFKQSSNDRMKKDIKLELEAWLVLLLYHKPCFLWAPMKKFWHSRLPIWCTAIWLKCKLHKAYLLNVFSNSSSESIATWTSHSCCRPFEWAKSIHFWSFF